MLRVVKVGGSLFDLPDLGPRIKKWLSGQSPARTVLVAGGGELADVIRRADDRHHLGQEVAHDLCIDLLGVTARWLAAIGGWRLVFDRESIAAMSSEQVVVLDGRSIFASESFCGVDPQLPRSWNVTTDSLAACLARWLKADELVLLKSQAAPVASYGDLAALSYVDPCFPLAARGLTSIRFVDIRSVLGEELPVDRLG